MAGKRKIGNDSTLPGASSNTEATSAKLYKDDGNIQEYPAKENDERQELLKKRVISYWHVGNDLHSKKLFKEAKKTYAKALKCLEEITDVNFKNHYYWVMNFNIALELNKLNENQEALKFCNIACASELCTKEKKKVVLNLRGTIHSILGQYIDAVKDFKASYDIIADFATMDNLNRNRSFVKFQISRFKFYNALRIKMDSTPEQIKNAIANLRANLKNGKIVERNIKRLTKLASQAELVLLDPKLKTEYDRGTGIMDVMEFSRHPDFYYFPPI